MDEDIKRLTHAVFGNGKEGLITKVARMEEQLTEIASLKNSINNIQQDIKVLLMFKAQESGKSELRSDYNKDKRWIVTSLIAIAGLCLTAIGMFLI